MTPLERKIIDIVKEIMQNGFDVAMGGDVFKSEEENKKIQEEKYTETIKKYSDILLSSLQQVREETIKEEHEICKKIHLIELNRWSIYEPNADECFEEEYQSLTNKREIKNSKQK